MKRILTLVSILLATVAVLTACDPESFHLYDTDIVSVELFTYDNPNPKTVRKVGDVLPIDPDKMEILETLDTDRTAEFAERLSGMSFLLYSPYSDQPTGVSIKVTYGDGSYAIISSNPVDGGKYKYDYNYNVTFDSDGNITQVMGYRQGVDSYENLVNDFFETKIE